MLIWRCYYQYKCTVKCTIISEISNTHHNENKCFRSHSHTKYETPATHRDSQHKLSRSQYKSSSYNLYHWNSQKSKRNWWTTTFNQTKSVGIQGNSLWQALLFQSKTFPVHTWNSFIFNKVPQPPRLVNLLSYPYSLLVHLACILLPPLLPSSTTPTLIKTHNHRINFSTANNLKLKILLI